MSKKDWIWMPHAGHLCVGNWCRFHLNTYVNGYIVSTVGEYFPDQKVRRINLEVKLENPFMMEKFRILTEEESKQKKELIEKILTLQGDYFDDAYLNYFGYEEIGLSRLYETMVCKAKKSENACCPYTMEDDVDFKMEGYNSAKDAYEGHYKICEKYDRKRKK